MILIKLIKRTFFLQNIASWFCSLVPPFVEHNLSKYTALRKAFYLTALENLDGDYLEFGVFTGSSFTAALRLYKRMRAIGGGETRFWGFDSFQGFGVVSKEDEHSFYRDSTFSVDAKKVIANIHKHAGGAEIRLIPGFFDRTLTANTASELGIRKTRIVFIDCDLMGPAKMALDWAAPSLQPGTILILDDFYSYRGSEQLGVAGAFREFREQHPHLEFRFLFPYGYGGAAYIVSRIWAAQRSAKRKRLG